MKISRHIYPLSWCVTSHSHSYIEVKCFLLLLLFSILSALQDHYHLNNLQQLKFVVVINCFYIKIIDSHNNLHTKFLSRAYRPQRGRGHVTATVLWVPSKIQTRQWFVTNYSNICCLDCTMHTVDFTMFSLDLNFARCLVTCPLLL